MSFGNIFLKKKKKNDLTKAFDTKKYLTFKFLVIIL